MARRRLMIVGLAVKLVGEPDAGNPHVRFDERGAETERWPHGPQSPRHSSTLPLRLRNRLRFGDWTEFCYAVLRIIRRAGEGAICWFNRLREWCWPSVSRPAR